MNQNSDNQSTEKVLIIIGVVAIALFLTKYQTKIDNVKDYIISLNLDTYLIAIGIFVIFLVLIYILVKIIEAIYHKITSLKGKRKYLKVEVIEIEDLLSKAFVIDEHNLTDDIERLRNNISICKHYVELTHFVSELKKRLAKARKFLEQARQKQHIAYLEKEIVKKEGKIENLDKEIYVKEQHEKNKNKIILWKLKAEENPVFFKDELTEKEINALAEDGYVSVSEYCVINKKPINFLVKPKLNHSPTHTFLVWNVKKFLKNVDGVKNIKESLTKEVDIVFDFNGKTYTLEIEKGNLLGKKKQLIEKVNYLNKNYPERWMFVVSNRNLLPKYRKFGPATQRKEVSEKLAKMLKIPHPI